MKPELPFGPENFQDQIHKVNQMGKQECYDLFISELCYSIRLDRFFRNDKNGISFHEGRELWLAVRMVEHKSSAQNPVLFEWNLFGIPYLMEGLFAVPSSDDTLIHHPIEEVYEVKPSEFLAMSSFLPFSWSEQQNQIHGEALH